MTMINFIRENREEIDKMIHSHSGAPEKLNDKDRREWILNDESLYYWAKSKGVKV